MTAAVPVNEPLLDGNEKRYLIDCIETGWISSEGPAVSRFEEAFAARVERRFAVAVCNGTAALELAVAALKLGRGDEIILPAFTIISCAAAVIRSGATPVLVDCDPLTWNMDPEQLAAKTTSKTKAILVVHIYGLPCDMDPILALAQKHNLKVIEDAAEMHGQRYKDRACGSFGDLSTFSFYPNKLVTTGEGGMVVTDDLPLAERCRSLRNLCFQPKRRFVHEELGWNFRMTNLQAALGLAQLERLDEFVKKKREIGAWYQEHLSDIPALELPCAETDYAKSLYWVFGIVLSNTVPFDALEAMKKLGERKIGTRPFFWPMHEQPVFQQMNLFPGESYPVAERIARRGFYIPSGLALTRDQQLRVAEVMHEIFSEY